jgi:hypothetical protein
MAKEEKSIKLIELSNSYVREPIVESKQNDWVLNGRKNYNYQHIIDLSSNSVTHKSILDSYETLVYGGGLGFSNGNAGVNDWAKLQTILRPRELRKLVKDKVVFNEWSAQVIETKGKDLSSIEHIAKQTVIPAIANEDNEIESYWFSRDWANYRTGGNTPENFPAFGSGGASQIFVSKPYSVGRIYFPNPVYVAGMQYMEMESEISNLNYNFIKSGLTAGYIINIPDGQSLTPEQKDKVEKDIKRKLTGSPNAGTFIINFAGRDQEPISVEVFPVNSNIHKQWEFLTKESRQQILTSHKCTSPAIVGVISSSGFSNTGDEMRQAREDLLRYVIKPIQNSILEDIEEILVAYGINLDLVFKPLTEVAKAPTQLSKHVCMAGDNGATDEMATKLIQLGETLEEDNWILLSTADVDYDTDDDLYGVIQLSTSTGTARPNAKSSQDSKDIAIRYRYVGNPFPERLFCKKMMLANKTYRKEDILQMNKSGVNDGFGLGGSNSYSIWLWKGGGKMSTAYPEGTCKHKWQREIYLKRGGGVDVNSPLAKTISTSEARRKGYKVPVNDSNVSIEPNKNR